jgi:hypothetical protein
MTPVAHRGGQGDVSSSPVGGSASANPTAIGAGESETERLARNPACLRLRALTLAGITPATAAAEIYGEPAPEGQSPFAIGAGNRFERALFEDGCARLLALYRERGRLGPDEGVGTGAVVDVSRAARGASPAALAERRALTGCLLRAKLTGRRDAPVLLIKPRLTVEVLGAAYKVEPDALVAGRADACYRVVEIKSYPDRGGKTAPADVRSACRQAAVGVVALRQALARLGVEDAAVERLAPAAGDLVLRQAGSFFPTLREMTLEGEVFSLARALEDAAGELAAVEAVLTARGEAAALDRPEVLDAVPNHYVEGCMEHCALAARCKREAAAKGEPALLGGPARELLAPAGSLGRALELLDGRGEPPRTPEEAALGTRLRAALAVYEEGVA